MDHRGDRCLRLHQAGAGLSDDAHSRDPICEGYACSRDGIAEMFAALKNDIDPHLLTPAAEQQLDELLRHGVANMQAELRLNAPPGRVTSSSDGQFTPEAFRRARSNFLRFIDAIPRGIDDPLARSAEKLMNRTPSLCPLWPFC